MKIYLQKNLKHIASTLLILMSTHFVSRAQLVVDTTMTPQELVENILLGNGVSASNFSFNGLPATTVNNQAGFFDASNSNTGISSGVILATEAITFLTDTTFLFVPVDPNIVNDPDLLELGTPSCGNYNNIAILEFDFVPAGDTMVFDYVFGSEEYGSFTCTQYNDAFGFFLSGPGINGTFSNNAINIANIPGTSTPVAINTVNSGFADGSASECDLANSNWLNDTIYFNRELTYDDMQLDSTLIKINGLTNILSAVYFGLEIGENYHIKMAIGDACDAALNSAVFFNGNSFRIMGGATSVSESNKKEIEISSLGNNGTFQISNTNGQLIDAVVYNLVGERVFQKTFTSNLLDLSNLSKGVYVAQFKIANKIISKKLVIN